MCVELRLAPEPVLVDGNANRLAQVVGNLLQNAAKFTAAGGAVRLSVGTDEAGARALICAADTGVGIAEEMLARLFQPFAQADMSLDRSQGGLGLGLALVKGLVELHGGDIEARSAGLVHGAEFTVGLPLALDEAVPGPAAPSSTPAPRVRRRVLVIEDDADAADTLRNVLELSDHEVDVAYAGPQGIAKAREHKPDVVLCDIGLPGPGRLRGGTGLQSGRGTALGVSRGVDRLRAARGRCPGAGGWIRSAPREAAESGCAGANRRRGAALGGRLGRRFDSAPRATPAALIACDAGVLEPVI